ncbi:endonuclease Q family protein [Caldanaerobius polysaccharolyticus]|uniref:endonuclease Q family protein n=1 Tax=Caldanaerobius polysaccharolyticus TaxID=44256 RepID=UPI00068A705C|nr:endonuclease Q family protein [Caldanaerobius polysaccharolyticus]
MPLEWPEYNISGYSADLHVHIGSSNGKAVKVTGSPSLTFKNIIKECQERKGVDIVGIVDCLAPPVLSEISELIQKEYILELPGGGLQWDGITIIPGCELEVAAGEGVAHCLCFFPDLDRIMSFASRIGKYIKNLNISTPRCHMPLADLVKATLDGGGIFVPAHVFTPFKSFYGSCTHSLKKILAKYFDEIYAVELGLSADADMADMIKELNTKAFLSNSDAHSLNKIGREFNVLKMNKPDFSELVMALQNRNGRCVLGNFGLNPKLGKYHRTYCMDCHSVVEGMPPKYQCDKCGSSHVVIGVFDRLMAIRDQDVVHPLSRPPYIYNVPLEFIPGIGKVTQEKLLRHFRSELYILYMATFEELKGVAGSKAAENIIKVRNGLSTVKAGGGGIYGHISV